MIGNLTAGSLSSMAPVVTTKYVAVAHTSTPYLTIYPWSAGYGTKYSNPATLPPSYGIFPAFTSSADNVAMAGLDCYKVQTPSCCPVAAPTGSWNALLTV